MITKDSLQEHFLKHNSITLYKPDGTPVIFSKQFYLKLEGGHRQMEFRDYDAFLAFSGKNKLRTNPTVIIG